MSVRVCLLTILLATSLVSSAQSWAQGPGASKVDPGQVDVASSRIYVHVGKTGLGHDHGVIGQLKSGSLQLGAQSSAGQFVFDMTTFVADTDAARKYVGLEGSTAEGTRRQVNDNMFGKHVLDVRQFPTATFAIDSALLKESSVKSAPPVYELRGKFTLHGVTRPLVISARVEEKSGFSHLRGKFEILQTDFGIKPYTAALGAVGVADQLTIYGDLFVAK